VVLGGERRGIRRVLDWRWPERRTDSTRKAGVALGYIQGEREHGSARSTTPTHGAGKRTRRSKLGCRRIQRATRGVREGVASVGGPLVACGRVREDADGLVRAVGSCVVARAERGATRAQNRGGARRAHVDENLLVTREAVASAEQLRTVEGSKDAPYGHDEVRFAFCSAAATSRKYDFGFLRNASSPIPPLWRGYAWDRDPGSVSSEQFEQACHDRKRLKEIADQLSDQLPSVPRNRWRLTLEGWTYGASRRLSQCTSLVVNDCSNVYFRGGLPIAAYLDASCRRRDVAEAELAAEIKSAGALANEATLADPITLVKHLHACSWARANGYSGLIRSRT